MGSGGIVFDDFFPGILPGFVTSLSKELLGLVDCRGSDTARCVWRVGLQKIESRKDTALRVDVHFHDTHGSIDQVLVHTDRYDISNRRFVDSAG